MAAVGAAVLVAGLPAAPALAKGADQVTITGPTLSRPVVVGGEGEPGTESDLAALSEGSGLFVAMFGPGGGGSGTLAARPPAGPLGPRYALVYRVPADRPLLVRQDLYPMASGGPVTYTAAGQEAFGGRTFGGWYTAPTTFLRLLARIGVPVSTPVPGKAAGAPSASAGPGPSPAAGGGQGGAAAAGGSAPAGPQQPTRPWVLPSVLLLGLALGVAGLAAAVKAGRRRGRAAPAG